MIAGSEFGRYALFACICAVLVAAAIGFAGSEEPAVAPAPQATGATGPVDDSQERLAEARLRVVARDFLGAFLRYEVGDLDGWVRARLRATAWPEFAAELLATPPRRPPRGAPGARLGDFEVMVVSALPPRVVISGSAERGGLPEEFSFVFEARNGEWRAAGTGG